MPAEQTKIEQEQAKIRRRRLVLTHHELAKAIGKLAGHELTQQEEGTILAYALGEELESRSEE